MASAPVSRDIDVQRLRSAIRISSATQGRNQTYISRRLHFLFLTVCVVRHKLIILVETKKFQFFIFIFFFFFPFNSFLFQIFLTNSLNHIPITQSLGNPIDFGTGATEASGGREPRLLPGPGPRNKVATPRQQERRPRRDSNDVAAPGPELGLHSRRSHLLRRRPQCQAYTLDFISLDCRVVRSKLIIRRRDKKNFVLIF